MNQPNPFPIPIAMNRDELDRQFDQLRMSALLGDGQTVTLQSQPDLGAPRVITELLDNLDDDALPDPEAQFSLAQRGPVEVVVSDVQKAVDGEWSLRVTPR